MKYQTQKTLAVVLAGNPNTGKTTIFNNLTGARQHVANYPGVTVAIKEGEICHNDTRIKVVDLPGTYSLTAYSVEELIARNYIMKQKPDVVVDIIDASNLERNLYLAVQLLELNVPLILVFNQSDLAKKRGFRFDLPRLSELLGTPIVPTVGNKGVGMEQLLDAITNLDNRSGTNHVAISYGKDIDREIGSVKNAISNAQDTIGSNFNTQWLAVKLLENDKEILKELRASQKNVDQLLDAVQKSRYRIRSLFGSDAEIVIADQRYGFISGACQGAVKVTAEQRYNVSEKIDSIVMSRLLGLPIFLLLMYGVFYLTFTIGAPPMNWIDSLFGWLGNIVSGFWSEHSTSLLRSLLVDGIIGGVGAIVIFVPNIMLLFSAIAVLEDSGYMARTAFLMDKIMHIMGLHGKSFIPMLSGFGCSIPGIMATRTLEHRHDRLTTMLVLPLMSCSARLPIYVLIIPAFFPQKWQAPMLWLIYIIGLLLAFVCAKILRSTLFKGEQTPFVMELPPYRIPTIKGVLIHMWENGWMYLKKAGTIILGISIILWALTTFPRIDDSALPGTLSAEQSQEYKLAHSYAGRIGKTLEPVLKPIGFDWKIATALIGAFAAKEVFVAQMGIVFSAGDISDNSESLRSKLRKAYTPLIGFCIMIYCLISAPCMSTFAITKKESGQWRWAFFQFFGLTAMAYVITLILYQFGILFQLGT